MGWNYWEYLRSPEWEAIGEIVRTRAGDRCEFYRLVPTELGHDQVRCHRTGGLHIHHIHYRTLYHERPEDLLALCPHHHLQVHVMQDLLCIGCGGRLFGEFDQPAAVALIRACVASAAAPPLGPLPVWLLPRLDVVREASRKSRCAACTGRQVLQDRSA